MDETERKLKSITIAAIAVAFVLVVVKAVGWWMTDSVALLGSLLDSVMDLLISGLNFFVIRHALTPADYEHRFGHGKAEAMAALGQAVIITLSAVFLIYESYRKFSVYTPVENGTIGIAVIVFSIIITLALIIAQNRIAIRTGSLAVLADLHHYRGDLYMNLAVIAALILSAYDNVIWADPLIGFVVAGFLLQSARRICRAAVDQLMDHELPEAVREKIKKIVLSHPDICGVHDLRTRSSGVRKFIQCHIELDGDMPLSQAHAVADDVEEMIIQAFPEAEVFIHQDPEGYEEITQLERS